MKSLQRGLSILLTVILVVTLVPILGKEYREVKAQDFNVSTEDELMNVIYKESVPDNSEVKKIILQNDLALKEAMNLFKGEYILDLNGHRLTYTENTENGSEAICIMNAVCTITDSVGTGSVQAVQTSCIGVYSESTLKVETVKMCSVDSSSCVKIDSESNPTVVLSNCDLEVQAGKAGSEISGGAVAFPQGKNFIQSYLGTNQVINNETMITGDGQQYTAARLIVSNGPQNEQLSVADSLDFGNYDFGTTSISDTKTITIKNTGNRDVVITDIALDTSLQDIFSLTTQAISANTDTESSLIATEEDNSTTVSVKSVPATAGTYSGNITVTYQPIQANINNAFSAKTLTIPVSLVIKNEATPFTVNYINTPQNPYTLMGTQGENEWYTSEVIIIPSFGYRISQVQTGEYTDSIVLQETSSPMVFLKDANGGITQAIPIGEIKIDTKAPVISGIENGMTYYANSLKISISDEHMAAVTLNSDAVAVNEDGNSTEITLISNNENSYEITAKDEAGHTTTYIVKVQDTWLRDGITTSGILRLRSGVAYRLGIGKWTVEGDTTVYEGGTTFYTTESGDYNFTLQ